MPRISGKDAEGLMAAYAKVHAPKEEVAVEEPIAETPTEEINEQQLNELGGLGVGGLMRMKQKTQQQPQQQAKPQLSGAQQAQQMAKDRIAAGKNTVTGQTRGQPAQSSAQQAQQMAKDRIAAGKNTVTGEAKPVAQQQQQQQQKPGLGSRLRGGLSRLGSLAGKAVGAIRSGAQRVGSAIRNRTQQGQSGNQSSGQPTPTRQQVQAAKADTTSPAAQGGLSADMRAKAAARTDAFNKANNRGKYSKPGQKSGGRPTSNKITSVMDMESYDLIDDTVNFLISEGHVSDKAEALSIMAEQEFIDAFTEGYQQVLNEEAQK